MIVVLLFITSSTICSYSFVYGTIIDLKILSSSSVIFLFNSSLSLIKSKVFNIVPSVNILSFISCGFPGPIHNVLAFDIKPLNLFVISPLYSGLNSNKCFIICDQEPCNFPVYPYLSSLSKKSI